MLTAVLAAIASAMGFAIANPIQHRSAGEAPEGHRGTFGLMLHLLRRPAWILGTVIGLSSFALHGVAVHKGALAVVQPIATSGMVFAVVGRPLLDGVRPTGREVAAAGVTAAGLTAFVVASNPSHRSVQNASRTGLIFVAIVLILASALAFGARQQKGRNGRGLLMGCAAGVLFGALAGVLKLTTGILTDSGPIAAVTHWPLYALIIVGPAGVIINQHAYQRSPLSVTMPVLNVVDVLVAVLFGYLVFGEVPAHGLVPLIVEISALIIMAVGIRELTRTPGGTFFGTTGSPPP